MAKSYGKTNNPSTPKGHIKAVCFKTKKKKLLQLPVSFFNVEQIAVSHGKHNSNKEEEKQQQQQSSLKNPLFFSAQKKN